MIRIQNLQVLTFILASLACMISAPAFAEPPGGKALRVCADPNNLPFSNSKQEGFENKIAQLFAKQLGLPLEYTWYPQRFGFLRNTLRARVEDGSFKCDLIMGVSANYPETATSMPYYRSTYMMVYVKGKGLDSVKTPQDLLKLPNLRSLKFGVFGRTPAADWVLKYNLMEQVVPYQLQTGDIADYTGKVIFDDLLPGKVNVLFIWGPIAGYFAKQHPELVLVSMQSENGQVYQGRNVAFDYAIAMGMRQPDKEWKEEVNKLIEKNRDQINAILDEYGVPLVKEQ
ncbi:MAG TPA: substrate-binding domain-containing protein [Burkholderiales bacterium]|nr:substrate-binding domain-containing protein [Burkholderiales bacterium]